MKIRSLLSLCFMLSALLPAMIFGSWAYKEGVNREFGEVADRHLLLAKSLGAALSRYHRDVVASSEFVAATLMNGGSLVDYRTLLASVHVDAVEVFDASSMKPVAGSGISPASGMIESDHVFWGFAQSAKSETSSMSAVMSDGEGQNVIYVYRRYDNLISIAKVKTDYFVELGKSISFGKKGHAAIVDQMGNVLAHPSDSWISERRNISKVSAVQRMMNGETGVEQFYSPALKGDMVAGLTHIPEAGWGVMIPQPVSELYGKVLATNRSIIVAIVVALSFSLVFASFIMRNLGRPMEEIAGALRDNSRSKKLKPLELSDTSISITEFDDLVSSYNQMVEKLDHASQDVERLGYTDSITKLPNRSRFQQMAHDHVENAALRGYHGALFFVDLDNFREVNERYGHGYGDLLLQRFAAHLMQSVEQWRSRTIESASVTGGMKPVVSRIGGDEFTILVPGVANALEADEFMHEFLMSMPVLNSVRTGQIKYTASMGAALYPQNGSGLEEIISLADIAMYHAKNTGRNRGQVYDASIGLMAEAEILSEFANAIERNELVLEYQPQICTRRRVVAGVEALVRWNHPRLGRLMPGVWLPTVSSSPMSNELCGWVVQTAMQDLNRLHCQGHDIKLAVNICSRQFAAPGFVSDIKQMARQYEIDRSKFEIEITEDALFTNETLAGQALTELREFGFKISVDDFGTGYSNFTRLVQLPLDFVKIDQSIVNCALTDPKVEAILVATVAMAKQLECKVVAEGVETLELAQFATDIGANLLQGYYFSKALPFDQLVEWMDISDIDPLVKYSEAA